MSSSITFLVSVLILTASFCIIISPCYGISDDVISNICSETQNQEGCITALKSNPNTGKADLPTLSKISLQILHEQGIKNHDSFARLAFNEGNPTLKNNYTNCVKLYENVIQRIQADFQLSQKRQFKSIVDFAQQINEVYACENGLPISSTSAANADMLLRIQTAGSVNQYVSDNFV